MFDKNLLNLKKKISKRNENASSSLHPRDCCRALNSAIISGKREKSIIDFSCSIFCIDLLSSCKWFPVRITKCTD